MRRKSLSRRSKPLIGDNVSSLLHAEKRRSVQGDVVSISSREIRSVQSSEEALRDLLWEILG
jgi:hypothetical protein